MNCKVQTHITTIQGNKQHWRLPQKTLHLLPITTVSFPQIKHYPAFHSNHFFAFLYSFIAKDVSLHTLFLSCPLLKSNVSWDTFNVWSYWLHLHPFLVFVIYPLDHLTCSFPQYRFCWLHIQGEVQCIPLTSVFLQIGTCMRFEQAQIIPFLAKVLVVICSFLRRHMISWCLSQWQLFTVAQSLDALTFQTLQSGNILLCNFR